MNCKVCNAPSKRIFNAKVLNKYDVMYFQCESCHFIQVEEPYWLSEAYNSAIASLDVGLVYRNNTFSEMTARIIKENFDYHGIFLDYAGGYGLFVRLMRDKGFNFYRQDLHCENIFAKHLDLHDLTEPPKFELVTAFEVFEHLSDPLDEIEKIFNYSDSVLLSTELVPMKNLAAADDWWYFVPETGQHIAFYSKQTLEIIAQKFQLNFFTDGTQLHLFTKNNIRSNPFESSENFAVKLTLKIIRKLNRLKKRLTKQVELESLIQQDFESAKKLLK
jgi:2-polyprenyl-3-methyl-5-hydroxy-6-metoxy-1,4-benzoquinol methylase